MPKLPKLKIKRLWGYPFEEIRNLEETKYFPFSYVVFVVEGQVINSYEELVQLAAQDCYKDKELLEVVEGSVWLVGGG